MGQYYCAECKTQFPDKTTCLQHQCSDEINSFVSVATPDISFKIDPELTARSAKTQIEEAMDRMAAMMPGYFGGNDRDGISKEERRKRTKMKKAAKKQRRM